MVAKRGPALHTPTGWYSTTPDRWRDADVAFGSSTCPSQVERAEVAALCVAQLPRVVPLPNHSECLQPAGSQPDWRAECNANTVGTASVSTTPSSRGGGWHSYPCEALAQV